MLLDKNWTEYTWLPDHGGTGVFEWHDEQGEDDDSPPEILTLETLPQPLPPVRPLAEYLAETAWYLRTQARPRIKGQP